LNIRTGHLSAPSLSAELARATWLVTHPSLPVIYSVAETAGGTTADSSIYSFAIDRASGALKEINAVDAGGRDSTHLDLDPVTRTLFAANHASGNVTALPLQSDGSLGSVVSDQRDYGTGPHRRQKSPAAHGVAVDPGHRYVLVADFGADRVFVYGFDGVSRTLSPAPIPFEAMPPGSGPRHLLFHPNGRILYINYELTGEVRSYRWNRHSGRLELLQSLSPYPADYGGERSAAEIAISRNGQFLYLSLRGDQNVIVAYSIGKASGELTEMQRISSQGKAPWSFGIDPSGHWMLVTNEASNSVAVLRVDPVTGKLAATGESSSVPSPVTVAFYSNQNEPQPAIGQAR
jgi:6-phosphogluconolactonase